MNGKPQLDKYQRSAVEHDNDAAVVLAGPGSGKTRVIAHRAAWLMRRGVPAKQILCVTFANDAAAEMRERIAKLAGVLPSDLEKTVSTFHSLALRIILAERHLLDFQLAKNFIADGRRVLAVLRPLVRGTGITAGQARACISAIARRRWDSGPAEIEDSANNAREAEIAGIYAAYCRAMAERGWLDFDMMVPLAVRLLSGNAAVQARWKFRHVIVDEAHDCDPAQQELARLLAANGVFCVGDPSQAIYSFRSANADLLARRQSEKEYLLPTNYRSTSEIIGAFTPYADRDPAAQRLVREMKASDGARGAAVFNEFASEEAEALAVATAILLDGQRGPKETAVLARTNAQLALFAEALVKQNIPVNWRKGFWHSAEVTDALAVLRLAVNPNDHEAFREAVTSPARAFRFLGAKFADAVLLAAKRDGIPPMDVVKVPDGAGKKWTASQLAIWDDARQILRWQARQYEEIKTAVTMTRLCCAIPLMLQEIGLEANEEESGVDNFGSENLAKLIDVAAMFDSIPALLEHAERMRNAHDPNGVTLSTIHRAKGLEWNAVYLAGVSDGIIPHERATDHEEERRLLYVAMSRARFKLAVSWHGRPSMMLMLRNPQTVAVTT